MRPEQYIAYSINKMCTEYIVTRWLTLFVFSGMLLYLVYVEDIERDLLGLFLLSFPSLIILISIWNLWVVYGIKRQLRKKTFPFLTAIHRKQLNAVLWIYALHTTYTRKNVSSFSPQTYRRKRNFLVVVLRDGKKIHIKARNERHVRELMAFLVDIFPHAVHGYSEFQKAEAEARIGKRIRNYLWFEF